MNSSRRIEDIAPADRGTCGSWLDYMTQYMGEEDGMTTYRSEKHKCPTCGEGQDALTNSIGEGAPSAGALTVCWKCGAVCLIEEGGKRKALTDEDLESLSEDEREQLFKIQKDARAGKINPYDDGKRILVMVDEGLARKFMRPFSEPVTRGVVSLRKACEVLDKACAERRPEVPDEVVQEAVELCRTALIDIGFEFTPEAEFVRMIASKIVEGPKRGWTV